MKQTFCNKSGKNRCPFLQGLHEEYLETLTNFYFLHIQDRRRHLEELWLQRKIRLEQHLQLLLLDTEVQKVRENIIVLGML